MKQRNNKGKRNRLRHSIKFKISCMSIIMLLVCSICNLLFTMQKTKTIMLDHAQSKIQELSNSYSQSLTAQIEKISNSSNFLMSSQSMMNFIQSNGEEEQDTALNVLEMYIKSNELISDVLLLNADGTVICSTDDSKLGEDYSQDENYLEMQNNGTSIQSDVFASVDGDVLYTQFYSPIIPNSSNLNRTMSMIGPQNLDGMNVADKQDMPQDAQNNNENQNDNSFVGEVEDENAQPVQSKEAIGTMISVVNVSAIVEMLDRIEVDGYSSGTAILLDTSGNLIYKEGSDSLGTLFDNEDVMSLIENHPTRGSAGVEETGDSSEVNLTQNLTMDTGHIEYTLDGTKYFSGYTFLDNNHWLLLVSITQADVFAAQRVIIQQFIVTGFALAFVCAVIAYLLTKQFLDPLNHITELVDKASGMNFVTDAHMEQYLKREDEVGTIALAIDSMRMNMTKVIESMNETSQGINQHATGLYDITTKMKQNSKETSEIAQNLSNSMQEVSATTEVIFQHVSSMNQDAAQITSKVNRGVESSGELMQRAIELKQVTVEASERTQQIYDDVKANMELAVEKSKAVEKVEMLTKTVMEIANQTRLLALNASIEAARAGDAGRGFTIVASEIGSLADQSAKTVSNIKEIILEIQDAVWNLQSSLKQSTEFLRDDVMTDYSKFVDESETYMKQAEVLDGVMKNIDEGISNMSLSMTNITDSIEGINKMVEDGTSQVMEVAEKNVDIVGLTKKTHELVESNQAEANRLNQIVDQFVIS